MRALKLIGAVLALVTLAACGDRVEVPPAHMGKIMTKDGYQEAIIPPSKFRLPMCWAYCDKLVLLDASDRAKQEHLVIFMPEDKLNLELTIQVTMSLDPQRASSLFGTVAPTDGNAAVALIEWDKVYQTYAQQIVMTETREYLSKFSIAQVASSLEKVNSDLRDILAKRISERTPFSARYVGITAIKYPDIITKAQENAAQRREQIQQEEAQLQISKVSLERELQEARLQRQIELERARTEAEAQRVQREVVDARVLELRRLENQKAWIEKWNGQLPGTLFEGTASGANVLMQVPQDGAKK